ELWYEYIEYHVFTQSGPNQEVQAPCISGVFCVQGTVILGLISDAHERILYGALTAHLVANNSQTEQ
ncbi:hypothetical protein ACFL3A_11165, partial [Pseudomonadota bacterium]